jgi:glycosyltransferase involved in cell wall biosynthesis
MDVAMMRRVYFYSNATGDDVRISRSIVSDSPAATRKVIGLCRALRTAGVKATIVSMGRGKIQRGGGYHPAQAGRLAGIPIVYGPMSHLPLLSQLLTMAWLLAVAARLARRRRGSVHLFYNQLTAFIPALVWLGLAGQRTFLDIEDGPVGGKERHATRFGNGSSALYARLINGGALLACTALAAGTKIRPTMVYYGAAEPPRPFEGAGRFEPAATMEVLFSGFLSTDTGAAALIDAVERMRATEEPAFDSVRINIAGMGPSLPAFEPLAEGSRPHVRIFGRLDNREYRQLLRSCAVGLSLKRIGGNFAETTFPSKTVEYAENGLAIVATDISDVRLLFGGSALYVERDDPEQLVAHLLWAARNRAALAAKAAASQAIVREQLSFVNSGRALARFLFPDTRT